MTGARKTAAAPKAAARPATVRRSTAAELATTDAGDDTAAVPAAAGTAVEGFEPGIDLDLGAWLADNEQKAQAAEAQERDHIKVVLPDTRPAEAGKKRARPPLVIEIPLMPTWPLKALRAVERGTVTGFYEAMAAVIDDADALAVIDDLKAPAIEALIKHLTAASGVTPGE